MATTKTTTVEKKKSVFETLQNIDVTPFVAEKQGYKYLPWADAWRLLCEAYPDATYEVIENPATLCPYFTDGANAVFVKVAVTVEGRTLVETFPVKDFKHHAIPQDKVTAMDINSAIQRGMVKCIARHGLGLYIFEGDDLPPELIKEKEKVSKADKDATQADKLRFSKFCADNHLNSTAIVKEVGLEAGKKMTNAQLDKANEIARALVEGTYTPSRVALESLFVGGEDADAPKEEPKAEKTEKATKSPQVSELATKEQKEELITFCKGNDLDVMEVLAEVGHDKKNGELTVALWEKAFALAKSKAKQ